MSKAKQLIKCFQLGCGLLCGEGRERMKWVVYRDNSVDLYL